MNGESRLVSPLTSEEEEFLKKRSVFLKYANKIILFLIFSLFLTFFCLYFYVPVFFDPSEVTLLIREKKSDTVLLLAFMVPVFVLFLFFVLGVFLIYGYFIVKNEKKYYSIVEKLFFSKEK